MSTAPDLVIRSGRVVDAAAGVDAVMAVAIAGGRITAVEEGLPARGAREIDAAGALVLPGLVDLHVHLDAEADGSRGHAMLARAGVTTALDLTGPTRETLEITRSHGVGLTIAVLEALEPERHLPIRPRRAQVRDGIAAVLREGAIGIKLHIDHGWGPVESAQIVAEAREMGVWVAVHCGTTATRSDLTGLAETIEIVGDASVQIAHVNSYCRGDTGDPDDEAQAAIGLLRGAPHLISESYLDLHNAAPGTFRGDVPASPRLASWLEMAGFAGTRDGVRRAILAGWAQVVVAGDEGSRLASGAEGVAVYDQRGGETVLCLPVNPPESRIRLATSRAATGRFDIDALATDGGGIPRNTTLSLGLALVDLGYFSLSDLVRKSSLVPAALLGLDAKGRVSPGADADVVIVDPATRRVRTTIAGGKVVFADDRAHRSTSTVLTTAAARRSGPVAIFDPARSAQYDPQRRKAITGR
jgi:imidazolonepropionase-like amidohydrolase